LQELQVGLLKEKDRNSKKPFKKRQPEEVDTQDLPGSDFVLPIGRKKFMMTMKTKTKKCLKRLLTRTMSWKLNQVRRTTRRMIWMMIRLNGSHVCHVRYEKNDQIASIVMVC
jgi:hypothetical protein